MATAIGLRYIYKFSINKFLPCVKLPWTQTPSLAQTPDLDKKVYTKGFPVDPCIHNVVANQLLEYNNDKKWDQSDKQGKANKPSLLLHQK